MNEWHENIRWELANYTVIHHIFIDFVAIEHQAIVIAPRDQTLHLFLCILWIEINETTSVPQLTWRCECSDIFFASCKNVKFNILNFQLPYYNEDICPKSSLMSQLLYIAEGLWRLWRYLFCVTWKRGYTFVCSHPIPVKPVSNVDSNRHPFTRQSVTRRPTTIRVPGKTDSCKYVPFPYYRWTVFYAGAARWRSG